MPIGLGTAIVGASAIGAVGVGLAANSAASAQKSAANQANQTETNMYNQNKAMLQPWSDQGLQAYGTLNNLLGVGGSGNPTQMQDTLNNLPGYQFTLNQGLKSTQNSAAARGLADSGAALKGAASYSTGLANAQYGNYVNQLQSSANTGESAANALAGYGTSTANSIGANTVGAGNAAAAGANATGAALSGGANNALGGYLYSLNNGLINGGGSNSASAPGYVSVTPNQLTGQYDGSW